MQSAVGLAAGATYEMGELLTAATIRSFVTRTAVVEAGKRAAVDVGVQVSINTIANGGHPLEALKDVNITSTFLSGFGTNAYSANIFGNMFQYSANSGLQTIYNGKVSLANYGKSVI